MPCLTQQNPLPTVGEGCSLLAKAQLELRDELGEGG